MLSRRLFTKIKLQRSFHRTSTMREERENPLWRTLRILTEDVTLRNKKFEPNDARSVSREFPRQADVVIIGGGAMGSSIAYWLKKKSGVDAFRVVVLEKDLTYKNCSTALSVGGLRQQFSLPENIQMSLYGADFLRSIKKRFGSEANVNFTPHGYLVLASESGAAQLIDNQKLQTELGAVNILLGKEKLKERFPWMDFTDVAIGCLGLEKEGWFDPWSLLNLLKKGAVDCGAQFVNGEAVDFGFEERADIYIEGVERGDFRVPKEVVVKLPGSEEQRSIQFAYCVIAGGAESSKIAEMAQIGTGSGMLSIPLPIEKRKRYVYCFNCAKGPGLTPMTIDYSGAYFRREGLGGSFICGLSPEADQEPSTDDLEVDYGYFDERIWPILAKRVPRFEAVKVTGAWGGFYDYNTFDENGIIGPHPYYPNLYLATGFSGHGIQQAPAVGRAISELLLDGNFQTLDLTRLGFDRLIVDKPMYEIGIY